MLRAVRSLVTGGSPRLLSVGFLLTYRCNRKCAFCRLPDLAGSEMTTSEVMDLLTQFRRRGVTRCGLSGGEPLLREDLGDIVTRAAELGFLLNINTNGWLLAEQIDRLRAARQITVSLDGPPELHDSARGTDSFARLVDGVRAAQHAGLRTAAIVVVTTHNLPVLRETLLLAKNMELTTYLQPVTACDVSGPLAEELQPEVARFVAEIRWILDHRASFRLGSSPAFLRHLLHYPHWDQNIRCRAGERFVYVTPTGELTACHVHFEQEYRPSALKLGVDAALSELRRPACCGCAISPYMELSLIANLNPGSIWHALRAV